MYVIVSNNFLLHSILVRYTQKAPQVSTPTLVEAARNLGRVGTKCCTLPEAQRLPCVEDYVSLLNNSEVNRGWALVLRP